MVLADPRIRLESLVSAEACWVGAETSWRASKPRSSRYCRCRRVRPAAGRCRQNSTSQLCAASGVHPTRCRRQTGSLPPRQASLPADQAFTRSLARQDQASSHPTIAVPDVAANLRWTSSTRIVIPPGSDERCYARQTARRQLRYNHNRAVQRERQPLSHRRHPSNAANRRQSVAGRRIGQPRRRASHSPGRPMEPETIRAQEQIAIM
jgi:hypothetical protein